MKLRITGNDEGAPFEIDLVAPFWISGTAEDVWNLQQQLSRCCSKPEEGETLILVEPNEAEMVVIRAKRQRQYEDRVLAEAGRIRARREAEKARGI